MEQKYLKVKVSFGILLIMIGIGFLLSDYVYDKREKTFSRVNVELNDLLTADNELKRLEEEKIKQEEERKRQEEAERESEAASNQVEEEVKVEDNNQYETFAGVLEIPKINFSKGFYRKGSELNNVKFNLKILDISSYPDEERGNVVIIGHSGNYSNSYFGNLYLLGLNDTASIQYQGKTYRYRIVNIYTDLKDGTVTIYRDETKNCLTLITCTKDDETTQTIYILERYSID